MLSVIATLGLAAAPTLAAQQPPVVAATHVSPQQTPPVMATTHVASQQTPPPPRIAMPQQPPAVPGQRAEETFVQVFYLTYADPMELTQMLTQLTQGVPVRPILTQMKSNRSLTVRATQPVLDMVASIIKTHDVPGAGGQAAPTPMASTPPPGAAPRYVDPRIDPADVNIRVDIAISDSGGSATPTKKTVTMLVANGGTGRIRSTVYNAEGRPLEFNVDGRVDLLKSGALRVNLTVNYAGQPTATDPMRPAGLSETIEAYFQNGKSQLVSQSADAAGDRKVTLDVTATVVK